MVTTTYLAEDSSVGLRLDVYLAGKSSLTRSQIQKFIDTGSVLINDRIQHCSYRIRGGDKIVFSRVEERTLSLTAEPIPLNILFSDDYLVVVAKPAGMVVYPAAGHVGGTLLNALAHHTGKLAGIGGPLRPGVVHRLDKDTSGLMVVAVDDVAYYGLTAQFSDRTIKRRYIALISGDLKGDSGEIALGIGRSEADRKKMSTKTRKSKEALTRWRVIKRFGLATLVEAKLGTGRTHQIRVHFSAIGHSVVGDTVYGRKKNIALGAGRKIIFPRQMLHAETLGFIHPITKKPMEFSLPIPDDMALCIGELDKIS